jgi:hypothetical protein
MLPSTAQTIGYCTLQKKKKKKTGYCRIFFQVSFKSTKTSKTNVLHFPNIYIYLKNKKTSAAKFIARP